MVSQNKDLIKNQQLTEIIFSINNYILKLIASHIYNEIANTSSFDLLLPSQEFMIYDFAKYINKDTGGCDVVLINNEHFYGRSSWNNLLGKHDRMVELRMLNYICWESLSTHDIIITLIYT